MPAQSSLLTDDHLLPSSAIFAYRAVADASFEGAAVRMFRTPKTMVSTQEIIDLLVSIGISTATRGQLQ
jgi:hypothetical protein